MRTTLHELLAMHQQRLLDKEFSGCEALLREDKVEGTHVAYLSENKGHEFLFFFLHA